MSNSEFANLVRELFDKYALADRTQLKDYMRQYEFELACEELRERLRSVK